MSSTIVLKLGTGEKYVTSNCMGHAVRQFEKGVSFRLGTGELLSHCHFKKKASDRLALQKLATAFSVESRAQNQALFPLKINSGLGAKPVR